LSRRLRNATLGERRRDWRARRKEHHMTEQTATIEEAERGFTAESFAAFWAKPDLSLPSRELAEDIVGYWPGSDEPLRGREAYVGALRELLVRIPDLTLSVAESASDGEYVFIRWIAHGTGRHGPVEHTGADRIKVRDGRVVENRIFFDRGSFERKLGIWLDL
jgi:ketosteroid isomerase-like protein